jgi:outer membrane protein OmpA-like peptidoglycan-associated protein
MFSAQLQAVEWDNKSGIGIRGPVFIPLFSGSDLADEYYEPYMMGWDGSFHFRGGFSKKLSIDLSLAFVVTYDDTTADSDMSFSLSNSDNAYSKLEGTLAGLTCNYYFSTGNVQPYVIFGIGVDAWKAKHEVFTKTTNLIDFNGKIGLGINFWLGESFTLDFQAKYSHGLANLSRNGDLMLRDDASWEDWKTRPFRGYLEPSVGLTFYVDREKDTDNDGVRDKDDVCPDSPAGVIVDATGCPIDSDGDGVFDGLDQCANTPKGVKVNINGCPTDEDGDGVFDGIDKCPGTPAGAPVDAVGCPLDSDNDGVADYLDKCPDTPAKAVVDDSGCPLDTDGDGVFDGLDKCPTTQSGIQVDEFGCPVDVKPPTKKITLHINYKSGSYEPDQNAKDILDELVRTLQAYTGTNIEINGFTDSDGTEEFNMELSEKRAGGVRDYLLSKGVEESRMITKGFGENPSYFVADNDTKENKRKNRRVEIISTDQ